MVHLVGMEKRINGFTYSEWRIRVAGWGMPSSELMEWCKRKRRPLPPKEQEQRRQHMIEMKEKGYPVTWLAKVYELSRKQVTRIINNHPNNKV
jgi:DNA invertase Pin-like site-specific DNA recombinase